MVQWHKFLCWQTILLNILIVHLTQCKKDILNWSVGFDTAYFFNILACKHQDHNQIKLTWIVTRIKTDDIFFYFLMAYKLFQS